MIANTNAIARNTLKEVKHEIQQVNWTLQEHSAAQKVREQGESLTVSFLLNPFKHA